MNSRLLRQHLFRAWSRHWPLQAASVTVMTLVLMMLNLLFLGYSAFNGTVAEWGRGLEMIVYLKEGVTPQAVEALKARVRDGGEFDRVEYTSKVDATRKFLSGLGGESLELLSDPKWSSPIPANLELHISDRVAAEHRLEAMRTWSARLRAFDGVEDVFYGQGWIENFSRFVGGARGLLALCWLLGLSVGLLIVGNCIRLSFAQRRDEIGVLELVGATARFIRTPFLLEGVTLGVIASALSLALSFALHSFILAWLGDKWGFWLALGGLAPLPLWGVAINLFTGMGFGLFGAWHCVRRLNTGWSAAAG